MDQHIPAATENKSVPFSLASFFSWPYNFIHFSEYHSIPTLPKATYFGCRDTMPANFPMCLSYLHLHNMCIACDSNIDVQPKQYACWNCSQCTLCNCMWGGMWGSALCSCVPLILCTMHISAQILSCLHRANIV